MVMLNRAVICFLFIALVSLCSCGDVGDGANDVVAESQQSEQDVSDGDSSYDPESTLAQPKDPNFVASLAETWTISTLDESCYLQGWLPNHSAVVDASGYLHAVFGTKNLSHAYQDATGWHTEVVDANAHIVNYTSLTIDGTGDLHACYYDGVNGDLKYAHRSQGGGWTTQVVDSTEDVGLYCSIAVTPAGVPYIAYYNYTSGDLKYAYWTGLTWAKVVADSTGDVGRYPSIALDSLGNPHITYYDYTNDRLKYAYYSAGELIYEEVHPYSGYFTGMPS
jgi:hypothetical protein